MDNRIIGTSMPVLEFMLQPGESVVAQGGELSWKSGSIQLRQTARAAGAQGFMGVAKRFAGGGSLFMTEYFAADQAGRLAFATKVPGQILQLELRSGTAYMVHRSGFLCGTDGVDLSVGFSQSMGVGLFGGTGFVLQRIAGDGTAWVELDGEVVTYDLEPGEVLEVSPGHVGLFEDTIQVSLTTIQGFKNMLLGGDGIFLVRMSGPGKVWLQSLPLPHLAGALQPYLDLRSDSTTVRSSDAGVGVATVGVGAAAVAAQTESGSFEAEQVVNGADASIDQTPAAPEAPAPEPAAPEAPDPEPAATAPAPRASAENASRDTGPRRSLLEEVRPTATNAENGLVGRTSRASSLFSAVGALFKFGSSSSSGSDSGYRSDTSYSSDDSNGGENADSSGGTDDS